MSTVRGGAGKSGVTFEVVEKLNSLGIKVLPLRLDRDHPGNSPLLFGKSLGFPCSPANALVSAVGCGIGVLILDQVDAIRWTAAHSSHSWDTCERTVDQCLKHANLRVVVVCRTFDMEEDQRIKAWKNQIKAQEIKIGLLDDAMINTFVSNYGFSSENLLSQQRELLRFPLGLYLWHKLQLESDDRTNNFRSMTDLLRKFWEMINRKLTKIKPGKYFVVLDSLVNYMVKRCKPSAPSSIVSRYPEEVDALLSMYVLVEANKVEDELMFKNRKSNNRHLIFSHQSFVDYLSADRVLKYVLKDKFTVIDWLLEKDQSLFQRGQLRQLLTLLRDDDPQTYTKSLKSIIKESNIRFHLKHLAIQLLGQVDLPTDDEVDIVIGLLDRPSLQWEYHVFFNILAGRESWFDALNHRGIIRSWLESTDDRRVNLALMISQRVVESRSEAVETLLLDRGKIRDPIIIVKALWSTPPEKLSDRLFDAMLEVKKRGMWNAHDFLDLKPLSIIHPSRCIRIYHERIKRILGEMDSPIITGNSNIDNIDHSWIQLNKKAMVDAATALPVLAWDIFIASYIILLKIKKRSSHGSNRSTNDSVSVIYNRHSLERQIRSVLREILKASGRAMVRENPEAFWDRVGMASNRYTAVQRLIRHCISYGSDEWADVSIRKIISDQSLLRSGNGRRGTAYLQSWKIIKRFSGLCSNELFDELLSAILAHKPKVEREHYHHYHKGGPNNSEYDVLKFNELGLGQYLLLSAMSRKRLNLNARAWLGVLSRKFGPIKPILKGNRTRTVGSKGSTIPEDRMEKVSDRNWLGIIRGNYDKRSKNPILMSSNRLCVRSVEMFASDIGRMTTLQPERFARLALQMPIDSDPRYVYAILSSLTADNIMASNNEDQIMNYLKIEKTESIIRRFSALKFEREFAMILCRAIEKSYVSTWSDDIIELLTYYAISHPDPPPDENTFSRYSSSYRGSDYEDHFSVNTASINCVRGVAAGAIKTVLFKNPNRLPNVQIALDSLIKDPNAAVRASAVGLALPLYNIDRDLAMEVFLMACSHQEDAVLCSHYLNNFLSYTIIDYWQKLKPLIERMIQSNNQDVAKSGAAWATVAWSKNGIMDDIVSLCMKSRKWHRMGVAEAITNAVARGINRPEVHQRLKSLFEDKDNDVRAVCSRIFRITDFFEQQAAVSIAETFLKHRAQDDDMDNLLYGMDSIKGKLKKYSSIILEIADLFSGQMSTSARDYRTSRPIEAGQLSKLLLRLYDQTEDDRELRKKCLDAWDGMLREGIGYDIFLKIDSHDVR